MIVEVLLLILVFVAFLYSTTWKPSGMPPGTFGTPLMGNLPPRRKSISKYLSTLRKKYGNIFTTKWGSRVIVVLADCQLIKKAFNHPHLQGRIDFYSFRSLTFFMNLGITFADGKVWSENRPFLLRNLRDLGMGKTYLEISIQEEAKMFVDYLERNCLDTPTRIDRNINVAVLNVIWQMLAGKRYEAGDPETVKYNELVAENIEALEGKLYYADMLSWITRILPRTLLNKILNYESLIKKQDSFHFLLHKIIEQHQQNLNLENPKDVVDYYLMEMESKKQDPTSTFRTDLKDLMSLMSNLLAAGSETTSTTLRWLVLYMATEQQIQKKIHQLIDEVVPKDRLPSLQDRDKLNYIDATLLDLLRVTSVLPTSLPHRATATVTFEGYTIPKDTMVLACVELCHRDPALWERPDQLYPKHFLDEDGKLNSKQNGFMPFSTGRRQCLGESLARMELFLFASALLQRFTIEPPPGVTLNTDPNPNISLFNTPMNFKVLLKKRL